MFSRLEIKTIPQDCKFAFKVLKTNDKCTLGQKKSTYIRSLSYESCICLEVFSVPSSND
jgi:hypothetical protein